MSKGIINNKNDKDISDIYNLCTLLFSDVNDILWLYDFKTEKLFISDKLKEVCGYSENLKLDNYEQLSNIVHSKDRMLLYSSFEDLFTGAKDKISVKIRFMCNNGQVKTLEMKGSRCNIPDTYLEKTIVLSGVFNDINQKEELVNKLNYSAFHDSLTELPNRPMLIYKTNVILHQMSNQKLAVAYFDLDNFKRINNIYGRNVGDEIIKDVGSILKKEVHSHYTLARPEGDEFIILMPNIESFDVVKKLVVKTMKAIQRPYNIGDMEIQLSCSVGIAIYPDDGSTAEELIKNSNAAMYKAKEKGKNQWYLFDESINLDMKKKTEMESNLRDALLKDEFYLVYQPQIDSMNQKLVGLEALIRWKSPVYGNVSPSTFIPIAEETGLIIPIGFWVIEEACRQCKQWYENYKVEIPISINVSAIQFDNKNFLPWLLKILDTYKIPLKLIKIEITESMLMENYELTTRILGMLRTAGISIALDDFGTGYSSLNYLKNLPLDTLKIDKSFVGSLKKGNREHAIVSSMIQLAHVLDMKVVAEGVETEEQYDCLLNTNCNVIQGYYFSKPIMPYEVEKSWFCYES